MERRSKVLGVTVPPAARVPVENAPLSRRESVFASLKPDRWAVNIGFLLFSGTIGTGGLVALNREPPAPKTDLVSSAAFEAEKAKRIQNDDLMFLAVRRQKGLEAMVGAALDQVVCFERRTRKGVSLVCGGFKLEGIPVRGALVRSESMDPPRWEVELDGAAMPSWPDGR